MPPPAAAEPGKRTPDYVATGRMAGGKPHRCGVILSMDPGCEGRARVTSTYPENRGLGNKVSFPAPMNSGVGFGPISQVTTIS